MFADGPVRPPDGLRKGRALQVTIHCFLLTVRVHATLLTLFDILFSVFCASWGL